MSPANRPFVTEYLQRRDNEGLHPNSLENYARALLSADELLGGKRFADATPQDWQDVIGGMRAKLRGNTVFTRSTLIRKALKDLLDVDKLPRALDKALYVRTPRLELPAA